MRRPDPLEWLLIAAALLAVAAFGQAVFVTANAKLVHTVTVTLSEAAASPAAPTEAVADGANADDMSGAHTVLNQVSAGVARDTAAILDRDAKRLAATNAALLFLLAAAIVVRARQITRTRRALASAQALPEEPPV